MVGEGRYVFDPLSHDWDGGKMKFNIMNGKPVEMVHFEITPDRSVDNKKVHDLFRSLSSFFVSPFERIMGKPGCVLWWDVWLQCDSIRFVCTVPAEWKKDLRKQLENIWPLCAIEEINDATSHHLPLTADVAEMKYRRSNIFAIKTDRRIEHEPLQSILSITSEMQDTDLARLSICAEPISRLDWQDWAERMHKEFQKGKTPRRKRLTKKDVFVSVGEAITGALQSILETLHTAIGGEDPKPDRPEDMEKRLIMIDGKLTPGTANKRITPTFNTYIRIASYSADTYRQKIILRTLSNSFNDLTAENELERIDFHSKVRPHIIRELNTYKLSYLTRLDWDKNKMSNEELGRLVELPTAWLQDAHKDRISTLDTRQMEVPSTLTKGGILLGEVSFKKHEVPVYMPIYDHDQLCLPTCTLGGMGSGKTKGFACNRAVEFVNAGFSSIMIDPAKSEMWEIIEKALPSDKRRRVLLGKDIISLDFREALRSDTGRGRLAQIILAFFEDNTDTAGAQTQRFLRAAVMGMQTGKLSEIMKIFQLPEYRSGIIKDMKEGLHKDTLKEFGGYKEDRQRQILAPILNRLDVILGDPYLEKCMNADHGIDMVEILSKRGMCTVFDVPDKLNTREAKDILINLLSFKIDAAMALRNDEFPLAVIYDEPHQYMRSAKLWKNVAVEARKYRLSYTWLFHSWEQIPRDLAQIIKDAGPHFFIYPSSKQTYKGLQEEITPFTVEDGLNTKRYHAICALRVGDNRLTPFMCRMSPPPG